MLRKTLQLCPRYDKDFTEVKYLGRRLAAPAFYPSLINVRLPEIENRFKDLGPDFDRVWVSLGNQARRRRIGRNSDRKDLRYHWRPIPAGIQRLYTNPARRAMSRIGSNVAPRLHPKANEQGIATCKPTYDRSGLQYKYGAKHAAPLPMDWEYRVL